MIKRFCDWCEKEVSGEWWAIVIHKYDNVRVHSDYELCVPCKNKIIKLEPIKKEDK